MAPISLVVPSAPRSASRFFARLAFLGSVGLLFAGPAAAAPECRMGTDGRQVCGHHCRMGTDGRVACANTESGACAMGTDGRVVCSLLFEESRERAECRMGTDGRQACGFQCRMGTDGRVACANTPDGTCAMGTDGRVVCTQVAPRGGRRETGAGLGISVGGLHLGLGGGPVAGARDARPDCRLSSTGARVCGYDCRMGSDGHVACASTPDGHCRLGADGRVRCRD